MHHRYDRNHIPIELLRTLVVIASERSFTKAGDLLGLTQSAVSAQIKRLQQLIGGDIFGPGNVLNERGITTERYARRILDLNDQLLSMPGSLSHARLLRIGLPNVFASRMLASVVRLCSAAAKGKQIQVHCGTAEQLQQAVEGGYLDMSMLVFVSDRPGKLIAEWQEDYAWIGSRELVLRPDESLPLVSWPNSALDRLTIRALEQAGVRYHITFAGEDMGSRMAAIQMGLGVMLIPKRAALEDVRMFGSLPQAASMRAGVCLRDGICAKEVAAILEALEIAVRHDSLPPDPRPILATGMSQTLM